MFILFLFLGGRTQTDNSLPLLWQLEVCPPGMFAQVKLNQCLNVSKCLIVNLYLLHAFCCRWIKSSDIKKCELCKFTFVMQSKVLMFIHKAALLHVVPQCRLHTKVPHLHNLHNYVELGSIRQHL